MTDINDKSLRQALIERFLNCDTTVAEERELARFYAECRKNGHVPEGEDDICELVAATVKAYTAADDSKESYKPAAERRTLLPMHWRLAAVVCVAIAVIVGAAIKFAAYNNKSTILATSNVAKAPKDNVYRTTDGSISAEQKVCMPDNSVRRRDAKSSAHTAQQQPRKSQTVVQKTDTAENNAPSAVDINNVYDMAMTAFRYADGITVERKGDVVLLTTTNDDGVCQRYVVGEVGNGQMTLAGL